eukprot:9481928-Alexandrium_andersonii.AAC.1
MIATGHALQQDILDGGNVLAGALQSARDAPGVPPRCRRTRCHVVGAEGGVVGDARLEDNETQPDQALGAHRRQAGQFINDVRFRVIQLHIGVLQYRAIEVRGGRVLCH